MTPLILLIMKSLPKVNDNYLNFIQSNEKLYSIAPIELKRQIWSHNTGNVLYIVVLLIFLVKIDFFRRLYERITAFV